MTCAGEQPRPAAYREYVPEHVAVVQVPGAFQRGTSNRLLVDHSHDGRCGSSAGDRLLSADRPCSAVSKITTSEAGQRTRDDGESLAPTRKNSSHAPKSRRWFGLERVGRAARTDLTVVDAADIRKRTTRRGHGARRSSRRLVSLRTRIVRAVAHNRTDHLFQCDLLRQQRGIRYF